MGNLNSTDDKTKVVSPVILLLIGISAGIISAIFPRLMTFFTTSSGDIDVVLYSSGFLFVVLSFALIIGISMIWIYLGTKESTKNLFLAALAIPSILSGGINMTNTTYVSQTEIGKLSGKILNLQEKLEESENILTEELVEFDDIDRVSFNSNFLPNMFGVASAFAAEGEERKSVPLNPGVKFKIPVEEKKYRILLEKSNDKIDLENKLNTYQNDLNIQHLKIRKSKNKFYLIKDEKMSKSDALIDAIKLKTKHNLSPKLLPIK